MRRPTRRRIVQLLAVSGIGSLAGCGSSDGGQGSPTETRSGPETGQAETATEATRTPAATLTPTPVPTATPTTPPTTATAAPTETATRSGAATIAAADGDGGDEFGRSVSLFSAGATAVVGAPGDEDPNGNQSGSAYVFTRSDGSWTQQAKLAADDGEESDLFGTDVSLSGDGTTAVVGAVDDSVAGTEGAGSAYIFTRGDGTWTQQAKLTADDGDAEDQFGTAVGITDTGGTVIVGARYDEDPNGSDAGSAYIFTDSGGGWAQQTKLAPDDGEAEAQFGETVAVAGDGPTAIVGAVDDGESGAVYVFSGDGWTQQAKLVPDSSGSFGGAVSVASDGDTVLVGAYGDSEPNGSYAGAAYVFTHSGGAWRQQSKLVADDGDSLDFFGWSVRLTSDGTAAVIGAYFDEDPNGDQAGAAYRFTGTDGSWSQQRKLAPADGDSGDQFGTAVGISGDGATTVVGARNDDDPNGTDTGAAYVFEDA